MELNIIKKCFGCSSSEIGGNKQVRSECFSTRQNTELCSVFGEVVFYEQQTGRETFILHESGENIVISATLFFMVFM